MTRLVIQLLTLMLFSTTVSAADTLVGFGSTWKYLDNGTDPGPLWTTGGFNDAGWAEGPAELGYGDGDESTVVSFGPDPDNKYVTTYYRHEAVVADPSLYDSLILRLVRDDGAVVYINGTEVFRTNMHAGTITSTTFAVSTIGGSEETLFNLAIVNPAILDPGSNTIAVEIHQREPDSSDTSFRLQLVGHLSTDPINVLRGPYLQRIAPDRAVVCWRTNAFTDSRIAFGDSPTNLTTVVDDTALTSDHAVEVTGLSPSTAYFYAVGTTNSPAAPWLAGADASHKFTTSPAPSDPGPIRVWAIGDSGTADANAAAVRDAYLGLAGSDATDLWLMLGDNAYDAGTDTEYQGAVFDMYPTFLRELSVWPTLGNHDGRSASITGEGPYYAMFDLPTLGENGGLASGTEAYYSFDHGNVHFVCLDSEGSSRSPGSAMLTWLENDLASTDREWIIAFWHHPPYTDGSHDSDDPTDSSGRLFDMRENVLPILEDGGVDLVLCGHSHSYERSFLLDAHYGVSSTLTAGMTVDGGDGDPTGDGAYEKPAGVTSHNGAVFVVAGSSGKTSSATLAHPAMIVSLEELGSVVLDIDGRELQGRFLRSNSAIADTFVIRKNGAFIRGDANDDGAFDVADPVTILGHLFQSASVNCRSALDSNDDESLNIADAVHALAALFSAGAPPTAPYPSCGADPTPGGLDCVSSSCP